jgi:hypothetical protein
MRNLPLNRSAQRRFNMTLLRRVAPELYAEIGAEARTVMSGSRRTGRGSGKFHLTISVALSTSASGSARTRRRYANAWRRARVVGDCSCVWRLFRTPPFGLPFHSDLESKTRRDVPEWTSLMLAEATTSATATLHRIHHCSQEQGGPYLLHPSRPGVREVVLLRHPGLSGRSIEDLVRAAEQLQSSEFNRAYSDLRRSQTQRVSTRRKRLVGGRSRCLMIPAKS